MAIKTLLTVFITVFFQNGLSAGLNLTVEKPKEAKLAEPFVVIFKIQKNSGYSVDIATENAGNSSFALISAEKQENPDLEIFKVKAIPFEIGKSTFPALTWKFTDNRGNISKSESAPFEIDVKPFLKKTPNKIRDIAGPLKFYSLFSIIAVSLIIILIISAVYMWIQKNGKSAVLRTKIEDKRTPYQKALDDIRDSEILWNDGKTKEFYIKLSEAVRYFISGEKSIPAPLMTTKDFLNFLKRRNYKIDEIVELKEFLEFADLVKFAKFIPGEKDKERDIEKTKSLIEKWRNPPEPEIKKGEGE